MGRGRGRGGEGVAFFLSLFHSLLEVERPHKQLSRGLAFLFSPLKRYFDTHTPM
jgi:hypothetical protein